MDDIVKDFLVESYENLDQLDRDLVALEQDPTSHSLLSGIFRTIHTIKGTCGFLSFSKLESVAHVGENLLSSLRDSHLLLNAEITSGLLSMVDTIRQMLARIEETGLDGENEYSALIATLAQLQEGTGASTVEEHSGTAQPLPPGDSTIVSLSEEVSPRREKKGRKSRSVSPSTELALVPSHLQINAEGTAEQTGSTSSGLAEVRVDAGCGIYTLMPHFRLCRIEAD
jgi:two-component system chemotaxis sensor kinase CheA